MVRDRVAKYRVSVRGQNCWLNLDATVERLGFFATRFIEASNPEDAEQRVIGIIRSDLRDFLLNARDDPFLLGVESVVELSDFPPGTVAPGAGYTWYPDDQIQQ